MPIKAFVGLQRGDEGKGKLVDRELASGDYQWNVRFQGGANAGHTVKVGDKENILHLIPSGVHHPNVKLGIGQGVIFDPVGFFEEKEALGIDLEGRLRISSRAKLVMPWDKVLDGAIDRVRAEAQGKTVEKGGGVGTTNRGIGPAYANAVGRDGVTVAHLVRPKVFRKRLEQVVPVINRLLSAFDCPETSVSEVYDLYAPLGQELIPFVFPLHELLANDLDGLKWVLVEGGQGRFLSNDCACSYPCCTSSVTTSNNIFVGLGLPLVAAWIARIVGVVKAYQSAVGNHPLPTKINGEREARLRERGNEYGATTGRPRHCCWLNALELRESAWANGCTEINVTKLDVLDEEKEIPIAQAITRNGKELHELPETCEEYLECSPVYGDPMIGWLAETRGFRRIKDLPAEAGRYLGEITAIAKKPITGVSNGPKREQFCT